MYLLFYSFIEEGIKQSLFVLVGFTAASTQLRLNSAEDIFESVHKIKIHLEAEITVLLL